MSYYFVNNRYPVSDPNMDLNFNNDILYQNILGDEAMIDPHPYDNADEEPKRARKPDGQDIRAKAPGYNISLCFILIVILVIIIFYMIHQNKKRIRLEGQTVQIPPYGYSQYGGGIGVNGAPHLVMLGPGKMFD